MDRRKVLKSIAIVSGGLITLPEWMISCGVSDTTLHQTSFTLADQKILASVADTIIPAGNRFGAVAVGVDKFLQKLFDDCYEKEEQDNIKSQLKALDEMAGAMHQNSFGECTQAQREALLLRLSASEKKEEKDFFSIIKSETIRGFNTSQKVMTEHLGYEVAPGHYYGCVDVKSSDHA